MKLKNFKESFLAMKQNGNQPHEEEKKINEEESKSMRREINKLDMNSTERIIEEIKNQTNQLLKDYDPFDQSISPSKTKQLTFKEF